MSGPFDNPTFHARFLAWINSKWTNKGCPRCNQNAWGPPHLIMLTVQDDLSVLQIGGGKGLPSGVMVCTNCGHTETVNLVVAGLWAEGGPTQ